jgi:hypothetical protein
MCRSKASAVTSAKGWRRFTPAALTRMSGERPSASSRAATRSAASGAARSAGTVAACISRRQRARRGVQLRLAPRAEHEPRAGKPERARDGEAQSGIAAGDERGTALEREQMREPAHGVRAAISSSPTIDPAMVAQSASVSVSGMRMSQSRSSTASVAGGVCGSAR